MEIDSRKTWYDRFRSAILPASILACVNLVSVCRADSIELKTGRTLTGTIVRENRTMVYIDCGDELRGIYRTNIASIVKDEPTDDPSDETFALRNKDSVDLFVSYTQADAEKAERVVRRIGRQLARDVHVELSYVEAGQYLIITNISPDHARQCADLLERLYSKVSELFGISPDTHVFVGRLPVFIFVDFEQFQAAAQLLDGYTVHRHVAAYHLTHRPFEPGRQHIVAYGLSNWESFAYTLVHETTHAFMARYIAERGLPDWVEEGFAEFVNADDKQLDAMLRGGPVNYNLARQIVDLLIRTDRESFLRFVAALKLGEPHVEVALKSSYGFGIDGLLQRWRRDASSP